ncbi:molybdopterin molybdotransferase MoeA [Micromonospora sp. NPDC049282]|uniref:molybdopterin molybdotransferase MoeA n=1 Tax=Micromonospora sp. NPDC049282 TaxID=3364269 RepID=UPI0037237756
MTIAPHRPDRHRSAPTATGWAAARALAHRLPAPLPGESVPLASAIGRTLAAPLIAAVPLPGFDNSAMDGYAVRGPGPWRVVGRVLAGRTHAVAPLVEGAAVEVATGAPVPDRADRVVPYEAADRVGDVLRAAPGDRRHIRRVGEYADRGQELVPAGSPVTPAVLGLAASVGLDHLTVRARPRARLLISGDEVVHAGRPPWGRVRDAIGPMLAPLLSAWGVNLLDSRMVGDEPGWFVEAIADSTRDADVTVVCGASSVGPADGLHASLRHLGAVAHVDGVRCRPGHPQVLAQAGARWIVGLPGNPFAALVATLTLVDPLLTGLAGRPPADLDTAVLTDSLRPDDRNTRIVPVRRGAQGLQVVDGAHPGYLGAVAGADALAVVPPGWHHGTPVGLLAPP